jgi:hypothetical protein
VLYSDSEHAWLTHRAELAERTGWPLPIARSGADAIATARTVSGDRAGDEMN